MIESAPPRALHFRMSDHGPTLATRRRGSACVEHLRRLVGANDDVVLDFSGVDIVTAPFLFEFFAGIREILREKEKEGAPIVVVANVEDETLEELELVLERRRLPLAVLRGDRIELLEAPSHLKDTLREAFELRGPFTTTQLAERLSLEGTAVTERLRPLIEGGVLSKERDPNAKRGVRYLYRAPDPTRLQALAETNR